MPVPRKAVGYAAYLRGDATGFWTGRRSTTARWPPRKALTGQLDDLQAQQACGMLHLSAALSAAVQADPDTATTHLDEASALADRMDTEVGTWAHLWFGPINVGVWRTSIAVELGEHGRALQLAKTVRPELLPGTSRQAEFWAELGRALIAAKDPRKGHPGAATRRAAGPQRIRHDVFVREAIADLLRQARRAAGGQELRGLAWRLGVDPAR